MMVNTDIRIQTTFFTHPKIVKLVRRLGEASTSRIIQLWIFTAQNKSDGNLAGMTNEDIEIAAGANDEKFVKTLAELKLIDGSELNYKIHNWKKHNSWAAGSLGRSFYATRKNYIGAGIKLGLKNEKLDRYVFTKMVEKYSESSVTEYLNSLTESSSELSTESSSGSVVSQRVVSSDSSSPNLSISNKRKTKASNPRKDSDAVLSEYPDLVDFCKEVVPHRCVTKLETAKQVDALLKLTTTDQTKLDLDSEYTKAEWKSLVLAILRWARADDAPNNGGFCWNNVFQSMLGLRVKGNLKFQNMKVQYFSSSKKVTPKNKQIDDKFKFDDFDQGEYKL